ncbi:FG-GAP-like repeat-containing protein [Demequina rhizosphaerae]|uniref:FG-GAP-like repeat-containing protein n=1 Tax=Demequina rhizosphaerae TaxID=1638985 RepID=UPI000782318F|nr:FG-GAP-like repeat-containing protein [Demequina rhizosphaerae]
MSVALAAAGALVAGPTPTAPRAAAASSTTYGELAAAYARANLVGKPYWWGYRGEHGFDCSGSVYLAWKHAIPGQVEPTWSARQYEGRGKRIAVGRGTALTASSLAPGDLLFWSSNGTTAGIYHVAMYVGGGQILQTGSGTTSSLSSMNFNAGGRMPYAIRPWGADTKAPSADYDAVEDGGEDMFAYGDFNGDGVDDVMWFTGTTATRASRTGWQISYGTSSGFKPFARVLNHPASPLDEDLVVADVDGDGKDDVLWFTGQTAERLTWTGWQVAYGTRTGLTALKEISGRADTPSKDGLVVGDFNGDARADVLRFTGGRGTGWQVSRGSATGFRSWLRVKRLTEVPRRGHVVVADFDGDRKDDLLWFTGTSDRSKRFHGWRLAYGTKSGLSALSKAKHTSITPTSRELAIADFTGDARADVMWFTGTDDRAQPRRGWQLSAGADAGLDDWRRVKATSRTPARADFAYADFTGDGAADVLWFTGTANRARRFFGWQVAAGAEAGPGDFALRVTRSMTPTRR